MWPVGAALADFACDEVREDGGEILVCPKFRLIADSHEIGEKSRVEEKRQGFGERRRLDGIDGFDQREFDATPKGEFRLSKGKAQALSKLLAVDGVAGSICKRA